MVASGKVSGSFLNKMAKLGEKSNIIRKGVINAKKAGKLEGDTEDLVKKVLSGKQSLQGIDLTGEMAKAVKDINQISALNRQLTTAIAVTGEARQEGINSSLEYEQNLLYKLDSLKGQQELITKTIYDLFSKDEYQHIFKDNPLEGNPLQSIKEEYIDVVNKAIAENREKALIEIKDASDRVAGLNYALNYPILYGSSLWQFGRTFAKGYDTQRGFLNNLKGAVRKQTNNLTLEGADRIVKEGGKYAVKNTKGDKILRGLKIASNPLAEANEEMLQAAAQTSSEMVAGAKLNERLRDTLSKGDKDSSFYSYKLDPEAEQEQIGLLNAI